MLQAVVALRVLLLGAVQLAIRAARVVVELR